MSCSKLSTHETGRWISCADALLQASLAVPPGAKALIICAHDGLTDPVSPRNQLVVRELHRKQFATLSLNLLTPAEAAEEKSRERLRLDIPLLTDRLEAVVHWSMTAGILKSTVIGTFTGNTISAAALGVAAKLSAIKAIVSRCGRTELADGIAHRVETPTLLIVGEHDVDTTRFNQRTLNLLRGPRQLSIVKGAGRHFTETGTLERVASHGSSWFQLHLSGEENDISVGL